MTSEARGPEVGSPEQPVVAKASTIAAARPTVLSIDEQSPSTQPRSDYLAASDPCKVLNDLEQPFCRTVTSCLRRLHGGNIRGLVGSVLPSGGRLFAILRIAHHRRRDICRIIGANQRIGDMANLDLDVPVRITGSMLGPLERPLLISLAGAMPRWVVPDMLTYLGLAGAALTCLAYGLSVTDVRFLWLASAGLFVNWFGDSLDGTLARVRQIERPDYGFVLDHSTDLASQMFIGLGAGISPFVHFDIACISVIVFLSFAAFSFMKTVVSGHFQISYAGIGPTEVRCAIVIMNTVLIWHQPHTEIVLWEPMNAVDLAVLAMSVAETGVLLVTAARFVRWVERNGR